MTKLHDTRSLILVASIAICAVLMITATNEAFAHMNFEFKPGNNVNNTLRVVVGETKEPAFTDEEHNLEFTITHKMTNLRLGNAHRSQTNPATTVLFTDTYFYPQNVLTSAGGVPTMTGCTEATTSGNVQTGKPSNCLPAPGWTDRRLAKGITTISVNDGGTVGQYRQADRQFYTQQGRTLYHVYGSLNYFNDTEIGLIPINTWFDGKDIKMTSVFEGSTSNSANNHTVTISSGFGLGNKTSQYWPGASAGVTEQTHPTNIRQAVGTIRDNNWDVFNFLRDIAATINAITGGESPAVSDTAIPPAKDYYHP